LERIIKAEINLVSVQSEVTVLKKAVEQEAEERKKGQSKYADKVEVLQQEFDNFVKNVSVLDFLNFCFPDTFVYNELSKLMMVSNIR
jgi:hypothetical protein